MKIQITNPGVRKALHKYNYTHAIAEFVWNGFDARATSVEISFDSNEIGNISRIMIHDNGYGIDYEQLNQKFIPFLESEKEIDPEISRTTSTTHGKNGVGRLTFFKFSLQAVWETVYEKDGKHYKYSITINDGSLVNYEPSEPVETDESLGTHVIFTGIHTISQQNFETDIREFLIHEFNWFLELNSPKKYSILINRNTLDYSSDIKDREDTEFRDTSGTSFRIRYVQWKDRLNTEYSRYYFIDSEGNEKFKKHTTLNNKGDKFYHSVYIQSPYFDNVTSDELEISDDSEGQQMLFSIQKEEVFKRLVDYVDQFLHEKRKPYIRILSQALIDEYQRSEVFPSFGENKWDKTRENELTDFVRELYVIEPKIFSRLNIEQQKTFVRLLNLIMDANESDALLRILDEVVDLTPDERQQLSNILKTVRLNNITKTIQLIQDRVRAIAQLKQLIDPDFGANEPDHIQKFIEAHYWLFGEQYHLVTAAEPDFEQALRKLLITVTGENTQVRLDHPDKNKEMDIFAIRELVRYNIMQSIVVELKNPRIALGEKELSQLKRYSRVIKQTAEFYGSNREWTFILVGNKFDTSGYIENELENNKRFGEKFIVQNIDRIKIYVMTWGEVITEFELRHHFLLEKLQLERESYTSHFSTPDELINNLPDNSASLLPTTAS